MTFDIRDISQMPFDTNPLHVKNERQIIYIKKNSRSSIDKQKPRNEPTFIQNSIITLNHFHSKIDEPFGAGLLDAKGLEDDEDEEEPGAPGDPLPKTEGFNRNGVFNSLGKTGAGSEVADDPFEFEPNFPKPVNQKEKK